jgi:hypothetical protein
MIDHDVMIAAKVSMLEHLVRDILVDRFCSMQNPVESATQYSETRWKLKPGAKIEADLEPARQAIWQEFLDSVVAGVRKSQEGK